MEPERQEFTTGLCAELKALGIKCHVCHEGLSANSLPADYCLHDVQRQAYYEYTFDTISVHEVDRDEWLKKHGGYADVVLQRMRGPEPVRFLDIDTDWDVAYKTAHPAPEKTEKISLRAEESQNKSHQLADYLEKELPPKCILKETHFHYAPKLHNPELATLHLHVNCGASSTKQAAELEKALEQVLDSKKLDSVIDGVTEKIRNTRNRLELQNATSILEKAFKDFSVVLKRGGGHEESRVTLTKELKSLTNEVVERQAKGIHDIEALHLIVETVNHLQSENFYQQEDEKRKVEQAIELIKDTLADSPYRLPYPF